SPYRALILLPRPPLPPLFPYTTLFRSPAHHASSALGQEVACGSMLEEGVPVRVEEDGHVPTQRRDPHGVPRMEPIGEVDELPDRSEEHTSELQSRENLVCRLLLEQKKQ